MSRDLYTFVGHKSLTFMNPMSESAFTQVIDLLDLQPSSTIADFGSGFCECALRIIERYRAHADCVELSPLIASAARERAARRVPPELIRIHEGDAGAFKATIPPATFDLTICTGSSHALGGYQQMLQTLSRLTKQGGRILVGEGYWKKEPDKAYLNEFGMTRDEMPFYEELFVPATALNLICDFSTTSSEQDFDTYEWSHSRAIESHVQLHPNEPTTAQLLARSRSWRRGYVQWGRDTLGFALTLFRKQ